ncbi:unnamed protein product, partial [Chrysoparadoxa australica]
MNQTAHISLQILSISKSVETKSTEMRPNFLARPACLISEFLPPSRPPLRVSRFVVARLASRWRLSAAGEGVFTVSAAYPQPLFWRNLHFLRRAPKFPKNQRLA